VLSALSAVNIEVIEEVAAMTYFLQYKKDFRRIRFELRGAGKNSRLASTVGSVRPSGCGIQNKGTRTYEVRTSNANFTGVCYFI